MHMKTVKSEFNKQTKPYPFFHANLKHTMHKTEKVFYQKSK